MSKSIYIGKKYNIQMQWILLLMWLPACYASNDFIWYGLPSCERCERHKGAWRDASKRVPSHIVMTEVNCDVDACEDIFQFPTIKYRMHGEMYTYKNDIDDADAFVSFANEIPQTCSTDNLNACVVTMDDVETKSSDEYEAELRRVESLYAQQTVVNMMEFYNQTTILRHKIILSKVQK